MPTVTDMTICAPKLSPGRWLFILLLVGLAGRLTLWKLGPAADIQRAMEPDSQRYVDLGRNLATHGSFGMADETAGTMHDNFLRLRAKRGELEPRDAHGLRPETMRTPGYPLLLAGIHRLGLPLATMPLFQIALDLLSISLVFILMRRLTGSPGAAVLAAAVTALHPALMVTCNFILTEPLFTCLMLAGLTLAACRVWRNPTDLRRVLPWACAAGLLLGLAALVRPIGLMLGVLTAGWLIASQRSWRSVWPALVLMLGALLPITGWAARNAADGAGFRLTHVDTVQHFTKNAAFTLMYAENRHVYPQDWNDTLRRMMIDLESSLRPGERVYDAMNREGWRIIREHPTAYAHMLADNAFKFMTDHTAGELFALLGQSYQPSGLRDALLGRQGPGVVIRWDCLLVALSWTLINVVLLIGAIIGSVRLWRAGHGATVLLAVGLILCFILATQAQGQERMRLPVLGLQAMLAAGALVAPRTHRERAG